MNILHVCKKYPQALGGDAVVVANLVRQQQAAGWQVAVLTSNCAEIVDGPGVYKFGLTDRPAALDTINWRRLVSLVMLVFTAWRLIARLRPQLIHTHSIDLAVAVAPVARWYGIPLVQTFHIVAFREPRQTWLRRRSELRLTRLVRPQLITTPNQADATALQQQGFGQAQTLPNGIDLAGWLDQPRRHDQAKFTFLAVGRLETQKGCEYIVRAVAHLVAGGWRHFQVIVIGEGALQPLLQKLINDLGVTEQIVLAGRQTASQTRQAYAMANCMIIAALWETTPLTLLEAWAMHLPVIATPVGILQDANLAARTVITVPIANAQKLAAAMQTVLAETDQYQPLVAEAAHQVQHYDWSQIHQHCQQLYEQVLA